MEEAHEKFELIRQRPELVSGAMLSHAKVNCDQRRVFDDERASIFGINGPTGNGPGSFSLKKKGAGDVHGNFEALRSDHYRDERIYVLSRIRIFEGGRPKPHRLDHDRLRHIADLINTLENSCGRPNKGAIKYSVIVDEQLR